MRYYFTGLVAAALLAGCVETTSEAGQKTAAKPMDEIDAAWASREEVVYNGKPSFMRATPVIRWFISKRQTEMLPSPAMT